MKTNDHHSGNFPLAAQKHLNKKEVNTKEIER